MLCTDLAHKYESIIDDCTTSQTSFQEMPTDRKKQLVRANYKLVVYVPCKTSPDDPFLRKELRDSLQKSDPEKGLRYSFIRLEEYYHIYMKMLKEGSVAQPGTLWHRDLQTSYTMFLVHSHNSNLKLERINNDGRLSAIFESADELVGTETDILSSIFDETDDYDNPSSVNFFPPDNFKKIVEQKPLQLNEITVAFPAQPELQSLEEFVMVNKSN